MEPFAGPTLITVLRRELRARLLNGSLSGCLLETGLSLDVGTIGTLTLQLGGEWLSDQVRIVRCQPIEGAGSTYHVGVQFLWTAPPVRGSLRHAIHYGLYSPTAV